MHRGVMHLVNAHDHVQDVERESDPPGEPSRWRYYCTCGWSTPWRDIHSSAGGMRWETTDRTASQEHFAQRQL